MIKETTWHRSEEKQTRFEWCAMDEGLHLRHENGNPPYVIPWRIFHSILRQAMAMAAANNGEITAGTHQSNPSPGSVGEWVLAQNFTLEPGALTPRHLSLHREMMAQAAQWLQEANKKLTAPDIDTPIADEMKQRGTRIESLKNEIIAQMRAELGTDR